MSKKLEDQLFTGERIVFRSHYGVVAIFISTIVFVAMFAILMFVAVLAIGGGADDLLGEFFMILILAGVLIARMSGHAVLVTDIRVLYRHGGIRRKVEDIRMGQIKSIEFVPNFGEFLSSLTVEQHNGDILGIGFVPRVQDLQKAIAEQSGLPPPRTDSIVTTCYGLWNAGAIICMLASMVGFIVFIFHIFQLVRVDISLGMFYAALAALPLLFVGVMIFGAFAGLLLGLVILRFVLTVDQARQLVCMGNLSIGSNFVLKLSRWGSRQSARFMSRLYGQDIHCD